MLLNHRIGDDIVRQKLGHTADCRDNIFDVNDLLVQDHRCTADGGNDVRNVDDFFFQNLRNTTHCGNCILNGDNVCVQDHRNADRFNGFRNRNDLRIQNGRNTAYCRNGFLNRNHIRVNGIQNANNGNGFFKVKKILFQEFGRAANRHNQIYQLIGINLTIRVEHLSHSILTNEVGKAVHVDRVLFDQLIQYRTGNQCSKGHLVNHAIGDQCMQLLTHNKLTQRRLIDCSFLDQLIQYRSGNQCAKGFRIDRVGSNQRIQHIILLNQRCQLTRIDRAVGDQRIQHVLLLNECRKLCGSTRILCNHIGKYVLGHDEIDNLILGFLIGKHLVDDRVANIRKFIIVQNDRYHLVHELIICHRIILLQIIKNRRHRSIIQHTTLQYDACGAVDVNHLGQLTRAIQIAKNGNKVKRSEQRFLRDELPEQRIWLLREIFYRHIHGHHLIQLVGIVAHHHIQISL